MLSGTLSWLVPFDTAPVASFEDCCFLTPTCLSIVKSCGLATTSAALAGACGATGGGRTGAGLGAEGFDPPKHICLIHIFYDPLDNRTLTCTIHDRS